MRTDKSGYVCDISVFERCVAVGQSIRPNIPSSASAKQASMPSRDPV